ncbi:cupin domain-containing protein [Pigmentiphaga soli]|uniref:Cupin domain-containing protein n=1 Tax=Pigmentiphaga soli TaxID=1007095 RepID=A0ABP8GZS2_9BURK
MALKHAQLLDVIDLHAPGPPQATSQSVSLLRTAQLQILRLVLAAGQQVPEHHVAGEVAIQCLEGDASVLTPKATCRVVAGQLVVLPAGERYSLQAHADTVLLATMIH